MSELEALKQHAQKFLEGEFDEVSFDDAIKEFCNSASSAEIKEFAKLIAQAKEK